MAPVATTPNQSTLGNGVIHKPLLSKPISDFYSPATTGSDDNDYKYAKYKVESIVIVFCIFDELLSIITPQPYFPDVHWDPLTEVNVVERGLYADPSKKNLLSAATKVTDLTPAIGTELLGIDLRQLSNAQKDDLCVTLYCDN
jgi:sulfonate dioxygenase